MLCCAVLCLIVRLPFFVMHCCCCCYGELLPSLLRLFIKRCATTITGRSVACHLEESHSRFNVKNQRYFLFVFLFLAFVWYLKLVAQFQIAAHLHCHCDVWVLLLLVIGIEMPLKACCKFSLTQSIISYSFALQQQEIRANLNIITYVCESPSA